MKRPSLILVTGLPGTGKTTFARALASAIGAEHLNSDIVRDALGGRGQYDEASKAAIYNQLQSLTAELLEHGQTVVVDATFYKKNLRQPYLQLAEKHGVPIRWIELKADEKTIQKRVGQKREYSEADFGVYQKVKAEFELLEMAHLTLRSDELPLADMVEKAKGYLAENHVSN